MNANDASPSSEKESLHPNLQAALSSLNLNLEEELNQFSKEQEQRITLSSSEPTQPAPSSSQMQSSLVPEPQDLADDDESPQSYLASSEELLRSLEESQEWEIPASTEKTPPTKETEAPKNRECPSASWRSYLLTPLGVAGILIFFLSGILLSMMFINIGQGRFSASSPSETPAPEADPPESPQPTESNEESASASIPNRPDLAEDEFIELDVENLVEAEPLAEVPVSEKPSCGGNFYCVMVENPDPNQYQRTRQLAPDAYVREFPDVGQVLQVGAFNTESRAEELQQRLEAQGVSAVIYYP